MKTDKTKTTNYDTYLIERLKNRKEAMAYLQAASEDEDSRVFLLALDDVKRATSLSCLSTTENKEHTENY